MSEHQCIECYLAQELLEQGAVLFDIRDQQSFAQAHPAGAIRLHNDNLSQLLSPLDKNKMILVLCYHGISSQGAAEFINSQGFDHVASINGGFEAWQTLYPNEIESS